MLVTLRRVWVALLLFSGCLTACSQHGGEITDVTQQFLHAAARGDTLAVRRLSQGDKPRRFADFYGVRKRALLVEAARTLNLQYMDEGERDSRMVAFFSFRYDRTPEALSVSVIPVADHWLITSVFLSSDF